MKRKEFERLISTYLQPAIGGRASGDLLVLSDPEDPFFLRGLYFESSGFDANIFRVTAFVQPLFKPADGITLTFGERLGGGTNFWTSDGVDEEAMMESVREYAVEEGVPFLTGVATPGEFADWMTSTREGTKNPLVHEATAYALILDGRIDEAEPALARAAAALDQAEAAARDLDLDPSPADDALRSRLTAIQQALRDGPDCAVETLAAWAAATRESIGV